jgi:negative regulator of sigma E activity
MDGSPESPIATSLRLIKALGLARQGKGRAAQALLGADGELPESAVELQALAALVTGEGDYSRALELWQLLLKREPGNREAQRMIASIELWLSRPPWIRYVPVGAAVLAVMIAVLVLAILAGGPSRPVRPVSAARQAAGADSAPAQPSQSRADVTPARAQPANPVSPPPPTIRLPGASKH